MNGRLERGEAGGWGEGEGEGRGQQNRNLGGAIKYLILLREEAIVICMHSCVIVFKVLNEYWTPVTIDIQNKPCKVN